MNQAAAAVDERRQWDRLMAMARSAPFRAMASTVPA